MNTGRTHFKLGHQIRLGIKHTESAKEKIRIAHLGKKRGPMSEATKEKIRLSNLLAFQEGHNLGAQKRWADHIKISEKKIYKYKYNQKYYVREKHTLEMRKWRELNREQDRQIKHKRKMIMKNIEGGHTLEEWLLIKASFGFSCPACKRKEPEITLTRDHKIPVSVGGTDDKENIQPLCASCNTKKFTKALSYLPFDSYKFINNNYSI